MGKFLVPGGIRRLRKKRYRHQGEGCFRLHDIDRWMSFATLLRTC